MAGKDGRNLKPTQKKIRDSKREGQTPKSTEAASMLVMAASVGVLMVTAPGALTTTGLMMRDWLGNADPRLGLRGQEFVDSTLDVFVAWMPAMLAAVVSGLVIHLAQGGLVLAPKTSRPSLKHLSWKRGLAQLGPKQALYTLLRNVLKFLVVGIALVGPVLHLWETLPRSTGLGSAISDIGAATTAVALRVVIGALLIGVLDVFVSRRKWMNKMMMNRQEIIDESKSTEGDPHTKAARRRAGMDLRRRRSIAPISLADVIVTNPTHFAVALSYTPGSVAPQVIAKGTERAAKKIRKEATRHGVPIIENRPLARALYRQVRVGGYVPERFFDEVVTVLVAAYWRRGKIPSAVQNPQSAPTVSSAMTHPGEAA